MSRSPLFLALLVAGGCAGSKPPVATPPVSISTVALAAPSSVDPAFYGAIADDDLDDRPAIQAAIDAACAGGGGTVPIGRGVHKVTRAPVGSYNRFAALSLHCVGVTFRGLGPESVLELMGDQGGSTTILLSIDPSAERIRVVDLTFRCRADSSTPCVNTDEQTHAIATTGVCAGATCKPISDVEIDHVRFDWPRDTAARKGDAIRILGNDASTAVYDVRIAGNNFTDFARSGVQVQRNVYGTTITGNTFHCVTGKTSIDYEATGGGWDFYHAIAGNTFRHEPTCGGDIDVAIVNGDGIAFTGNVLTGELSLYRCNGCVITGNAIRALAMTGDEGAINVQNVCEGTTISGNSIARGGHAGPAIKLVPHSGALCNGFAVTGNSIVQGTAFHGIYGESWSRAVIANNVTTFTVTAAGYSGVYNRSVYSAFPVHDLSIGGNVVAVLGPALGPTYAVTLHASPGGYGAAVVVAVNASSATLFGLHLDGPAANFAAAITSSGGALGADAYGSVPVVHGD